MHELWLTILSRIVGGDFQDIRLQSVPPKGVASIAHVQGKTCEFCFLFSIKSPEPSCLKPIEIGEEHFPTFPRKLMTSHVVCVVSTNSSGLGTRITGMNSDLDTDIERGFYVFNRTGSAENGTYRDRVGFNFC